MATTIRELLIKLGVKADDRALQRFDTGLKAVRAGMLAAAAGAIALTTAVAGAVAGTASQGDEAAKAAKRIGINAQEMQELGFAAEQSGARVVDVETAMRRQAVAARDAAEGTGAAADSYAKMGISVTDANGQIKPQLQLLDEAADGIKGLTTETEKLAVANDIFGRGGAKLLPLLNEGSEGIRKLREQARDLGFVLDEDAIKASEDFTDRLNELRKIVTGLRNRIGLAFMPVLTRMIERFRDWFIANRRVIDQRMERVTENVRRAVDLLAAAFERVDRAVREGPGSWGVVFRQVGKVLAGAGIVKGLRVILPILTAIGSGILAIPALLTPAVLAFAALAAAILGAVLIGEDFVVFLQGGDSAIGVLLESFDRAGPFLEKWNRLIAAGSGLLMAMATAAMSVATAVGGPIVEALAAAIPGFVSWETALIALDALILGFILNIETRMERAADAIELVTLALTDLRAFGAEVFGRVGELLANISGAATQIRGAGTGGGLGGTLARGFQGAAAALGGVGASAAGAVSERFGPRPALAGGPSTTIVNQEGDTITIPTTVSGDEVQEILRRRDVARRRQAAASIRGGDR
jgi:hypothetical protein